MDLNTTQVNHGGSPITRGSQSKLRIKGLSQPGRRDARSGVHIAVVCLPGPNFYASPNISEPLSFNTVVRLKCFSFHRTFCSRLFPPVYRFVLGVRHAKARSKPSRPHRSRQRSNQDGTQEIQWTRSQMKRVGGIRCWSILHLRMSRS